MPSPPKKESHDEAPDTPARDNWATDQRERGYYYDDAHGYQDYDPDQEKDEDSRGGPLDVDLDRTPPLLIEPEETENEPGEMSDQHRDPNMDRS